MKKDEEPIFVITDLLVHLSAEQMENKADKVIEGEKLDLIVGNKPMKGIEKEAVKENNTWALEKNVWYWGRWLYFCRIRNRSG